LEGLFPGLVAYGLATNVSFGYITNTTAYYTNLVKSPYGSPPVLVTVTNLTPAWITNYVTSFGNVVTNHFYSSTVTLVQTVAVGPLVGSPYGSPAVTNITAQTVVLPNVPSGDYYLLTAGLAGYSTDATVYTNIVITTNTLLSATNTTAVNTNATATNSISYTQTILSYATNYWLLVQPLTVTAPANAPALRRGIGRVEFIRANYDAILGQTFEPITNYYSMVKIDNNSQQVPEYYQRVVTVPDFLFQAQDLTVPNPPNLPYGPDYQYPIPTFDTSAIKTQLAGPGAIIPGNKAMIFNKTENDLYLNGSLATEGLSTNQFLNESTQSRFLTWGAFDGTTNLPVVYPSSASIASLMNQLVIQVTTTPASATPGALPDGYNGHPYSVAFTATGGQAPLIWAGGGLGVPGLTFNAATATLSGIPAASGTYAFTVQVTDSVNRVVNLNYSITIH
jgi:hypothetical protein